MAGFKKEAFLKKSSNNEGKGSFYGVHQNLKVVIQPKVDVPAPPSDLLGPHLNFSGPEPIQK